MVDKIERNQISLNKSINKFLDTKGIYDDSQKLQEKDIEVLIKKIIRLNKYLKKKKINKKKNIINKRNLNQIFLKRIFLI